MAKRLSATRSASVDGRVYGETNNRMALIVPAARDAFPEAQFVWLLRDGRDFVASEMQRSGGAGRTNWWAKSKWERWRIRGDLAGDVSGQRWRSWDAFERLCWQWAWTNRLIARDLAESDKGVVKLVRIEGVASALPELACWLGIEQVEFAIPRANRRRSVDDPDGADHARPNNVDTVASWTSWTPAMRSTFETHCADLMAAHYPKWRDVDGAWCATPAEVTRPRSFDTGLTVIVRDRSSSSNGVSVGVANDVRLHQTRVVLAETRARAAATEVALYEARSAYDSLISSAPSLLKHLAIVLSRRIRRRPPPGRGFRA